MSTSNHKDTIYIDVDDEITGIIDKLRGSKEKIVALVLPKRAAVLQSIVNMKLLKRTADEIDKKVVLITSEANLLPLAGAVGLYVAKTLQSAPRVPDPPSSPSDLLEADEDDPDETEDTKLDHSKAIGELAGLPVEGAEETIEVDNEAEDSAAAAGTKKAAKDKKLKVPNFEKFRTKLFLIGAGLVALLFLWIMAYKVLPKATITITTDSSTVDTNLDFTADASAKTLDETQHILPATQKTLDKTDTEKVTATGQKDLGTKASGTMTLTNCIDDGQPHTIPAGTAFSSGGLSFVSKKAVTLEPALYSGSNCKSDTFGLSKDVGVSAAQAGSQYNLSSRSYTSSINGIVANGSDMTGGNSKIVKVISQADIDAGKQKILDRNNEDARAELTKQMQAAKLFVIKDTFKVNTPTITSSPKLNEEGSEVTVSLSVTYSMLGVSQDDLSKLVENDAKKHIDQNKQTILNTGLDNAQTQIKDKKSDTLVVASLQTTAEAGARLDETAIKNAVKGKKRGDTQNIIEARPGIKDVKIDYSPFWVGATPTRMNRIKVIFVQPNGQPSTQ